MKYKEKKMKKKTHHKKKESFQERAFHKVEKGLKRLGKEASPWNTETLVEKTWHDDFLARKM